MVVWNNPPPAPVPGLQNRVFFSGILNDWVGLNLLLPAAYSQASGPYPVLYWFHAEGGNEASGLFLAGLLAGAARDETLPPFVTVLVNWGARADGRVERIFVEELVPFVDKNYATVAERRGRSLEGVGRGGVLALSMALKHPQLFASVSVFAAGQGAAPPAAGATGAALRVRLFAPDRNPKLMRAHRARVKGLCRHPVELVEEVLEGFHDNVPIFYDALGPGAFFFHAAAWGLPPTPYRRVVRSDGAIEHRNLEFARHGRPLLLDLTVPPGPGPFPVIVYFFGGAFRFGGKSSNFGARLVAAGYASVSAQYRLTGEAPFPAQRDDAREATAWLRAHAGELGLDAGRIGVWGMSAGAWVASMLGVCPGDESSQVQAVCDFYGPTDFLTMDSFPGTYSHDAPTSAESRMVRGPIQSHADRVSPATPLNFVSSEAPPFLIVHDPRDQYVPYDQSERLHQALTAAGVESTLVTTHESEYPFHGFDDQGKGREAVREAVDAFFAKHLKP